MKRAVRPICILILTVLILAANTVFSVAETDTEAVDMREVLTVSDEKHAAYADRLLDRVYGSYISYGAGEAVSVQSSEDIGYAFIAWETLPAKVTLTWLDMNRKAVSSEERAPAQLDEYVPAPQEGICGFRLTFPQETAVSELGAYTMGRLPDDLPLFESSLKDPALMVIAGYPGDELVCFGGLLPAMVDRGVPVQIVYMNRYNRERQEESLRTLWKMGMRNAPIFLNTSGKRSLDGTILKSTWENFGNASKSLLDVINTCRPSVIVTHGKTRPFPLMAETEATYTVFTGLFSKIKGQSWLKKVYLTAENGSKDGEVYDLSAGYVRAAALYEEGYDSMKTFHYAPWKEDVYTLYHTNAGKDTQKDLLENVSYTALSTPVPTAEPTPEPTAEPTPEPTLEPTPTPEPTAEPSIEPTMEPSTQSTPEPAAAAIAPATPVPTPLPQLAETKAVLLPILLSIAAAAILFAALVVLKKVLRMQLPVVVGILVPVLAGAVICVGLFKAASINKIQSEKAEAFEMQLAAEAARTAAPTPTLAPNMAPTPTPTPTEEPTPKPTEEPTPAPTYTPEPTAVIDPEAELYTNGEEIIEKDADAGRWSYKSSTLSMQITQYTGSVSKMEFPYYVADIHMRADEFRAGFGHESRNGMTSEDAIKIARRYKAVLMITGDNIKNMDIDKKGVLIRDGYSYNNGKKADIMVWHPEKRTIELVAKEKITSAKLIAEGGVENVISFGPTLIRDGEKTGKKALENHWLYKTNPRVGIGMQEPGHFIVVVGGYRSDNPKANLGWNLVEFADLMESLGCQQAYNVDGGVSACMIFMGERLNRGGAKKDWSALRNLPDGIIFGYSANVPE